MNTTTLTHELDAALDLLKDRLHRPLVAELEAGDFADNLLAHFRQRRTPVLPFTAERLPEIARLAQERDPEEHAWVKRIADEAIAGRLYGASNPYADHFIEVPDDFDFSAIDGPDPQTIHGLNRHRWFAALARHYWDAQDRRYFDALLRHWEFYWANVPPIDEAVLAQFHCIGPNQRAPTPYHELDNFIRLHAWWWAFWVSVHAPEMTGERCAVLLARCLRTFDLVAARGIRIHEHNFTAMQMESLYFWAVSLPECIGMDVWRHAARNNLESSLNRAVTEDGVHWEQSVSYHNGCIGWYGHSYLLGRMNGEPWAEAYGDRLLRMGGFVDAVITPDGKVPLLSDSDRVGNWRNGLALLRCIDPEVRFAHDAGPSYPSVWYSGGQNWTPSDPPAAPLRLGVFPQGGIGVARHPDRALGTMLLFDNGPTQAGHAHKDNLTVHFEAHAKPVLVDPGRWIYDSSAERSWVMQTPSHNTIWIEDEPLGTDERITTPRLHIIGSTDDRRLAPIQTQERDGIARLSTRFKGYTDDADAEAQRTVWMPMNDSAPWLAVLDRISAPGAHIWTNTWLLPTSEPVRAGQGGYTATLDSGLPLRFAAASSETLELRDDAKFWCPNYGEQSPARWLRFSARCTTGWRAFIFLPCESERPMPDITFDGQTLRLTIDGQTITCPA